MIVGIAFSLSIYLLVLELVLISTQLSLGILKKDCMFGMKKNASRWVPTKQQILYASIITLLLWIGFLTYLHNEGASISLESFKILGA